MSSSSTYLSPPSGGNAPTRPSLLRSLSSTSSVASIASYTKKNKPRLYLALYARGTGTGSCSTSSSYNTSWTCPSYHWALIIGPKSSNRTDPGTCLQVVHSSDRSWYEEVDLSSQTSIQAQSLLLRITLAKVRDEEAVKAVLRTLPPNKSCACSNNSVTSSNISLSSSSTDRSGHSTGQDRSCDADTCCHDHNNCLIWVRNSFEALFGSTHQSFRLFKSYLSIESWPELEECVRRYAKKKRNQGRFHNIDIGLNRGAGDGDGHAGRRDWDDNEVATWNFWERRETTH